MFKTRADRTEALIARFADLHSYDVPAAVVWPIEYSLDDYEQWVTAETSGSA